MTVHFPLIGGEIPSAELDPNSPPPAVLQNDAARSIVSFDMDMFDNGVHHHGVRLLHFRAMRCPIGMQDRLSIRKVHAEHSGCSHGFLYTYAGVAQCLFTSASGGEKNSLAGQVNDSQVSVTPPRFYEDSTEPFYATRYDRLYLDHPGAYVANWQLFETDESGVDKLDFPVERVIDLVDAAGVRYVVGRDFELRKGKIHWTGASLPPRTVCASRYLYRPYWYVVGMPHELRVARADLPDGSSAIQRMPQHLTLQREYLFESELPTTLEEASAVVVSARTPTPPTPFSKR